MFVNDTVNKHFMLKNYLEITKNTVNNGNLSK